MEQTARSGQAQAQYGLNPGSQRMGNRDANLRAMMMKWAAVDAGGGRVVGVVSWADLYKPFSKSFGTLMLFTIYEAVY